MAVPARDPLAFLLQLNRLQRPRHLAMLWVIGSIAIALVAFSCYRLGLNFATTAFAFLIVIVLLSLLDSFVSSAIFSAIAVGCLNFFFVEPLYTLFVGSAQDLLTLAAFLITSLAVTSLMRRVRSLEDTQHEQARLLDLTAEAEARLRAVIDTVPASVWSTWPSGETDFQNKRLLSYIESSSEGNQGAGWVEMLHPEDAGRYAEAWKNTVAAGASFECELRLRRADGQYRWFLARAEPLRDEHGNITKWYGTNVDIDDRKQAGEALRHAQERLARATQAASLAELSASIAHEVNQPLAAIAANGAAGLRWLARPEPDLVELRELTESVVADAQRAADIVGRIRAMVVKRTPEHGLLTLDEVIREALLFVRHELQLRAVTVSHHPAPDAPQVLGDRTQLQQVIVNLAINAMQAMAQAESGQRRIAISVVASEPACVRCTVEDSGPGIEPEHLASLFESFFTTKEGGMGMGLPICRSIIEAHAGRISADNASAEGGARFTFTLPDASQPH